MKFDFEFKTIDTEKEVKQVINFIKEYPLNYANYFDWVEKVYYQFMNGEKEAIIAFSENRIIGDLIFQKIDKGITEIKNIRVHTLLQNRGFAHFMLNQLENELVKDSKGIILDTRVDNSFTRKLFESRDYKQIGEKNLYENKFLDAIYYKNLIPNIHTINPNS